MAKAFDKYPEFYLGDNRKNRISNPITKEQIENKHEILLPEWVIKNKTILDLGSCVGATGQWCLFNGAKSYTGVELQENYYKKSKENLKHYGNKVTLINSSIEDFLMNNKEKYDVICLFGVMHVFIDYYSIFARVSRICNETIILESSYPNYKNINVDYPGLEFNLNNINLSDIEGSMKGFGTNLTPSGCDIIMKSLGFGNQEGILYPKTIKGSFDRYNYNPKEEFGTKARYLLRYRKTNTKILELSKLLKNNNGDTISWNKMKKGENILENIGNWQFNSQIAKNFQEIAKTNIPNYEIVINKCLEIAKLNLNKNDKILDIGSAIGYTIDKFYDNGFKNIFGIDNSEDMLKFSSKKGKIILRDNIPKELGQFKMILANWTLHFVINERKKYLENIFDSLENGGLFILSEKIACTKETLDLYHNFKEGNGLSKKEIDDKNISLKGVLIQYPLEWYLIALNSIGFKSVEIIDAHFGFVTIFAIK